MHYVVLKKLCENASISRRFVREHYEKPSVRRKKKSERQENVNTTNLSVEQILIFIRVLLFQFLK